MGEATTIIETPFTTSLSNLSDAVEITEDEEANKKVASYSL